MKFSLYATNTEYYLIADDIKQEISRWPKTDPKNVIDKATTNLLSGDTLVIKYRYCGMPACIEIEHQQSHNEKGDI